MATDWTADAETVGAWKMDEASGTLQDASANNNDLTASGTPGTYNVAGKYDGSFDFTQSNNSYFSNASITGLVTHSGCAWIAPDDDGDVNVGFLTAGGIMARNSGDGWGFGLDASNDLRYAHSWTGSGISRWVTTANVIPYDGSFTHVAFTYAGTSTTNNPVIYVNGVAQSITETNAPVGSAESGGTFMVGIAEGSINEFDGNIDDVLYSSQILTSTDVNEIMDNGIDGTHGAVSAKTASTTKALISVIANTTTASKGVNKTTSPAKSTVILIVNNVTCSKAKSAVAQLTTVLVTVQVNTATASAGEQIDNKTATLTQAIIQITAVSLTASKDVNKTATPSKQLISVVAGTPSVSKTVIKTATTTTTYISVTTNSVTCTAVKTKTATATQTVIRIVVNSTSGQIPSAFSLLSVRLLLNSRIEKRMPFKSRIETRMDGNSKIEPRLTVKSALNV